MAANYIADFDSRPDTPYVKNQSDCLTPGALDYFDAEWDARVYYDRPALDADLADLAGQRREQIRLAADAKRDNVLIVLNRPAKRVTVKGFDFGGKTSKTRYFGSVAEAQAKVAELKKFFGGKGIGFRVWVPA